MIPVTCQKKLGQPARIFFFFIRVYVGPPVRDLPLFKIMFLIIFTFKYPSSLIVISPLPLAKSDQPDIFLGVAVIEKTYLSVAVLGEFLSTLFYVTFFLKFQLFGGHRVVKKMWNAKCEYQVPPPPKKKHYEIFPSFFFFAPYFLFRPRRGTRRFLILYNTLIVINL